MTGVSDTGFTDPVQKELATYEVRRRTHEIPLDWFLVRKDLVWFTSYDRHLKSDGSREEAEQWSIKYAEFDYSASRVADGTGKPFRMYCTDPEGTERRIHFRTHRVLELLDYDRSSFEMIEIVANDSNRGVLVTVQERFSVVPNESGVGSSGNA
ncbi:hypothetical protein [Halorubrum coriense]|uniref:hypothetical protein n=1 Tax=Halorubrum coriense TaxID=64713 RepID=UPI001376EA86|nr:hypothetical protein [Halorubrum coriense]